MHKSRVKRNATKRLSKILRGMPAHPFGYPDRPGSAQRQARDHAIRQRDMRGYGANPPDPKWPGGAHVCRAVRRQLRGRRRELRPARRCRLRSLPVGDRRRRSPGRACATGTWNSIYEYGARAGFWRLHRMFTEAAVPVTVYGVATALARSPDQVAAMQEAGWEIASHGLKWIDYRDYSLEDERRAHGRGDPAARRSDRRAPDRLVHRPHLGQHGAPRRRGRRLRLRLRHL